MNRDKIVEMAIEIVTQEGYSSLSMRYLADRLGTSTMGIYYYFASKNELLGFLFSLSDGAGDAGELEKLDPFERAVRTSEAVAEFLEVHSWALSGVLDGHVGIEELTRNHALVLTESVRDLGFDDDEAAETVRGIWRIALGEAVMRSSPVPAGVGAREAGGRGGDSAGPSVAETIESYLSGRLTRVRRRSPSG
ncbi:MULTISPECIES: TetR/AcrR family transcriptional regulator [Tsukamurella]|nr:MULTISPECIES: TetR/AcrR family transcriptional regulator [Tsukamurella]NMD57003.1 helix-turn-helix transcriptional regulator [Tsukamurella columbiensis]